MTEIVEGTTGRLSFQLKEDGANLNGTGLTVSAADLVGADGAVVDTTGDIGWITDTAGTVYYDPDAADFVAGRSPYQVRFQITDGAGKVIWFPSGLAETIKVYPRYQLR